ncbi:MAG: aldehyde ferredoxin oxidoreductase family protein [Bacillota bacterium]
MDIARLRDAHRLVSEFTYELGQVERGYTDRTLYVNLSDGTITSKPVSRMMKEKFIGGRGFGMWYLWNAVNSDTKWDSPENTIVISSGPIGGVTQYPGSGKSLVVTISPLTNIPIDSNVGGYFGPLLKFAGWDALEIQGKAQNDVILYIDGNKGLVKIEEAPEEAVDSHILAEQLTEMYAETEEDKKNISIVSAGTGAEHSYMGLLNFTFYDPRRQAVRLKQAGRGGIGTVFRDKRIKAIVVKFTGVKGDSNAPADISKIQRAGVTIHREIHDYDDLQNQMRKRGTTYLVEVMDQYDLLPTHNFKYGKHPESEKISAKHWTKTFSLGQCDGCWYGCTLACAKVIDGWELKTGPYQGHKVLIDGPEYETIAAVGSNCGIFDPDHVAECNFYCDTYGIDTISLGTTMAFVMECYEAGFITKEMTGGLELRFGNAAAMMEVLHQLARGEGFGKIVGMGVRRIKEWLVAEHGADAAFLNDIGMESKGLEFSEYMTKESLAQQGGYGLTNKGPQHDEAWLIFDDMVKNLMPTFEDKAEALYFFPLFRTWFGLVGLCKLPWNDIKPIDNDQTINPALIIEHVQNSMDVYNGVTGENIDLDELILQSARVYNLQRVLNLKLGYGRRQDDAIPYRAMGPVTRDEYESRQERYDSQLRDLWNIDPAGKSTDEKIAILRKFREENYEQLVDAVYKRRGWTSDGVPKIETLRELGIDFPELVEVIKPFQS